MYTAVFGGVAVVAAQDLFEIVAAAGKPVRLHAVMISQSTDVGDAAEELLRIQIKSGQTTSGSGGTVPTAIPLNVTDAAAGAVTEVNNTTKATAGTIVTHYEDVWNVRMPYQLIFTPEMRPEIAGGRRATVELVAAPVDSLTMSGSLVFEEIG